MVGRLGIKIKVLGGDMLLNDGEVSDVKIVLPG
jgi:hypothetical protein